MIMSIFNDFLQSFSSSSGKRGCCKVGKNNSLVFVATASYRRRSHKNTTFTLIRDTQTLKRKTSLWLIPVRMEESTWLIADTHDKDHKEWITSHKDSERS